MVEGKGINDMPWGWRTQNRWNELVYEKWRGMIRRCYNEKDLNRNPTYRDCFVCDSWLTLSNFIKDFPKIEGYDHNLFLERKLSLDKDIKSNGLNKCYSLDNCMLVSLEENVRQMTKTRVFSDESRQKMRENHANYKKENHPRARKVAQYSLDGTLLRVWDYIKQAEEELGVAKTKVSRSVAEEREEVQEVLYGSIVKT